MWNSFGNAARHRIESILQFFNVLFLQRVRIGTLGVRQDLDVGVSGPFHDPGKIAVAFERISWYVARMEHVLPTGLTNSMYLVLICIYRFLRPTRWSKASYGRLDIRLAFRRSCLRFTRPLNVSFSTTLIELLDRSKRCRDVRLWNASSSIEYIRFRLKSLKINDFCYRFIRVLFLQ